MSLLRSKEVTNLLYKRRGYTSSVMFYQRFFYFELLFLTFKTNQKSPIKKFFVNKFLKDWKSPRKDKEYYKSQISIDSFSLLDDVCIFHLNDNYFRWTSVVLYVTFLFEVLKRNYSLVTIWLYLYDLYFVLRIISRYIP